MKFVAAILTLAAVATAAPAEVVARTNPPTGGSCSVNGDNNGKVTCCGEGLLGGLLCNILAIGNSCNSNQEAKCCKTDSSGGLIDINLGCTTIL